mmetsp:Transcript_19244/g.54741  ORF Transcript_19244/g.54741 Transcript_19244/m.54741 type:complete len:90 (-) Transcript_19244:1286-1555(-)
MSSHPIPHTTGHGVSALILGVLLATSLLTPKWRILALLVATCAELHAVVFLLPTRPRSNVRRLVQHPRSGASPWWNASLPFWPLPIPHS